MTDLSFDDIEQGETVDLGEYGVWEIVSKRDAEEGLPVPSVLIRALNAPNAQRGEEEWVALEKLEEDIDE